MARVVSALCAVVCLASGVAHAGTLSLAWDRNPESDVNRYRLVYGTAPGVYTNTLDCGNNTECHIPRLTQGKRYYVAVQAGNSAGLWSPRSAEVSGLAVLDGAPAAANILLGQGQFSTEGGYFAVHGGVEYAFGPNAFARVPWPTYNATGGSVRPATGDIDGDGLDEVVLGLGRGSNGYVAVLDDAAHNYELLKWIRVDWPTYNAANGEVYPAVGNLDSDSRAEIVLGLGPGSSGWYQVIDDASQDFAHIAWKQVPWPAYTTRGGGTHPAVGDLDGDGKGEIVLGLESGSAGWLQVVNGRASNFSHGTWIQIATFPSYTASNGTTFPAIGDLDGDGEGEIVIGLGRGSQGWFEIKDDAASGFAHRSWQQVSWPAYNRHSGEVHPAIGNVDGDAAAEIVLGLADFPGNGGWFAVRDDAARGYAHTTWQSIGWSAFTSAGGALFPAISDR